jgi:hypothetical protein
MHTYLLFEKAYFQDLQLDIDISFFIYKIIYISIIFYIIFNILAHIIWEKAPISNTKMIDISNVTNSDELSKLERRISYNDVACYFGKGRFKNFKLNPPYHNLSMYFGNGAGNITIFEY